MSQAQNYLALDLGAETGRAILGRLENGVLHAEEVHRFPNEPVRLGETLYWDLPRLVKECVEGIRRAGEAAGGTLAGVAVDSWGVDFGLLDARGEPLTLPVHYRDLRTRGSFETVFRDSPREAVFDRTGVQFLEINTLFQLRALKDRFPEILFLADKLLPIADLVAYFLSGRAVSERSLASTTQLLDARADSETRGDWCEELLREQGLPRDILPEIVEPATLLGPLHDRLLEETGLAGPAPGPPQPPTPPQIIAAASHDTACAVAAIPATDPLADGETFAYISSGTWSLVGIEVPHPILDRQVLAHDFTNEAGAFGTTRLLRIVCGLWLVQECRRQWAREGTELSYEQLADFAEAAPAARGWLDLCDPELQSPGDMPAKICEQLRASGQAVPTTRGEIVRCCLESLARTYLEVIRSAESLTSKRVVRLHVVGGGSQNRLLNQLTADLLGIPVIAGPVEATATGNLLLQAVALGHLQGSKELREVVARSTELITFEPCAR